MIAKIGKLVADFFAITELRAQYREMGNPSLFWVTIVGTLVFIGLFAWLMTTAQWPGTCDHEGRRLWGLIKSARCSPDLLGGGPKEIGLFVMIWTLPATLAGALLWRLIYEIRQRRN